MSRARADDFLLSCGAARSRARLLRRLGFGPRLRLSIGIVLHLGLRLALRPAEEIGLRFGRLLLRGNRLPVCIGPRLGLHLLHLAGRIGLRLGGLPRLVGEGYRGGHGRDTDRKQRDHQCNHRSFHGGALLLL